MFASNEYDFFYIIGIIYFQIVFNYKNPLLVDKNP